MHTALSSADSSLLPSSNSIKVFFFVTTGSSKNAYSFAIHLSGGGKKSYSSWKLSSADSGGARLLRVGACLIVLELPNENRPCMYSSRLIVYLLSSDLSLNSCTKV